MSENGLVWLNRVTAGLHGVWATLLVVLRAVNDYEDSFQPLHRYYTDWSEGGTPLECVLPANCSGTDCRLDNTFEFEGNGVKFAVSEKMLNANIDLSVHWLVVGFFLLSFAFQMFTALPQTQNMYRALVGEDYIGAVKEGRQPIRFVEYAISAAIMLVLIALENGIRDASLLWCIGALTTGTQVLGLVSEDYRVRKDYVMMWATHATAWATQGVAMGVILARFGDSGGFGGEHCNGDAAPPSFVTWTIVGQFVLFSLFGITQLVQNIVMPMKVGDSKDIEIGFEMAYVLQSLISKSLLCFTLYFPIFLQLELP